jgi:hypothetical protein
LNAKAQHALNIEDEDDDEDEYEMIGVARLLLAPRF